MNVVKQEEYNLIRKWFEIVQDRTTAGYLTKEDYQLAAKIYENCGWAIPESIAKNV